MSYSEVVNEIQGDELKAIKLLAELADDNNCSLQKITELSSLLKSEMENYYNREVKIIQICQHIKLKPPFQIINNKLLYEFDKGFKIKISDARILFTQMHKVMDPLIK
ncbi:MAG: hypothetical protein IPG12_14285 [Saprospiraceae bacterium]|nr:hypothetical protein [Saprospiraceae bacterium]